MSLLRLSLTRSKYQINLTLNFVIDISLKRRGEEATTTEEAAAQKATAKKAAAEKAGRLMKMTDVKVLEWCVQECGARGRPKGITSFSEMSIWSL